LGPFRVLERVTPVSYRLSLPPQVKMHPVFHVSWLLPYVDGRAAFPDRVTELPPVYLPDGSLGFEAERVLEGRKVKRRGRWVWEYLVLWRGQPVSEASWEPAGNLSECPELIADWHAENDDE
jgi:hypothetical protein